MEQGNKEREKSGRGRKEEFEDPEPECEQKVLKKMIEVIEHSIAVEPIPDKKVVMKKLKKKWEYQSAELAATGLLSSLSSTHQPSTYQPSTTDGSPEDPWTTRSPAFGPLAFRLNSLPREERIERAIRRQADNALAREAGLAWPSSLCSGRPW